MSKGEQTQIVQSQHSITMRTLPSLRVRVGIIVIMSWTLLSWGDYSRFKGEIMEAGREETVVEHVAGPDIISPS